MANGEGGPEGTPVETRTEDLAQMRAKEAAANESCSGKGGDAQRYGRGYHDRLTGVSSRVN